MAKSSKKSKETAVNPPLAAQPPEEIPAGPGSAEKLTVGKSRRQKPAAPAKAAGKSRGVTSRKPSPPRKPRAATLKKSGEARASVSDEEIRTRAYFIAERRQQQGLPGDSAHDWLEALRQLQEEAGQRA